MSYCVYTRVDSGGAPEAAVEDVADLSERRQAHPTRLDGTTARHAVTLALLPHPVQHVLYKHVNAKQLRLQSASSVGSQRDAARICC